MGINQKDIKLLWGRAASRCSFSGCRLKLTEEKVSVDQEYTLGEQAHIVAEKEDGARGKSPMTEKERNSYSNLILLCPTHHTMIDNNPEDFPVEKIHQMKVEHEQWVQQTLSHVNDLHAVANQAIYGSLIDAAVEYCDFNNWDNWVSWAIPPDQKWHEDFYKKLYKFQLKISKATWPGKLHELERALITLSITINLASDKFFEHDDRSGDYFIADRFYRQANSLEEHERLLEQYNKWSRECYVLLIEATKAANWVADVVRRDINPLFFAEYGRFMIEEKIQNYSDDEKFALPELINAKIN